MVVLERESAINLLSIPRDCYAVADAMMVVQSQMMQNIPPDMWNKYAKTSTSTVNLLEEILAESTKGECRTACVYSLHYLFQKYRDLFSHFLILEGEGRGRPFRQNPKWSFHTYFLVQSKEGKWFAGSPANHIANSSETPTTRMLSSSNLSDIMEKIKGIDGGHWPAASFAEELISKRYTDPKLESRDTEPRYHMGITTLQANQFAGNIQFVGYRLMANSHI